jgi:hypothetical protein
MKKCSKCKIEKSIDCFKKHRQHRDGIYSWCKNCVKSMRQLPEIKKQSLEQQRAWRSRPENLIKIKSWSKKFRTSEYGKKCIRNNFLKRLYGITPEDYTRMFTEQNGCCAICNKNQKKLSKRLAVDHDHETNQIRELLCGACNAAIGIFEDNIELLQAAIQYLLKHKKEKSKWQSQF